MTYAKKPNRSGSYDSFLSILGEGLRPEHLPAALQWAASVREGYTARSQLAAQIVRMGWEHLNEPGVLPAFADLAQARFAEYQDLLHYDEKNGEFAAAIASHPERRRALAELLVERMGEDAEVVASRVGFTGQHLLDHSDLGWLIDRTAGIPIEGNRGRVWTRLLQTIAHIFDPADFELLYAHRDNPHVAAAFGYWWTEILLESETARALRADHDESLARRRDYQERVSRSRTPPSAGRVIELLDTVENSAAPKHVGNTWCAIVNELTRSDEGDHLAGRDLDTGAVWGNLGDRNQERILELAERYVRTFERHVSKWLKRDSSTYGSTAGYKALRLLDRRSPERLVELPRTVWIAWLPVVLRESTYSSSEDDRERYASLLARARAAAPQDCVNAVQEHVRREALRQGGWWNLDRLDPLWNSELAAAILKLAKEPLMRPDVTQRLLDDLTKRGVQGALEYAASLLSQPLPSRGTRRQLALAAGTVLLRNQPAFAWPLLLPLVQRKSKFRRELALSAMGRGLPLDRLTENQLAELFAWLTEEFPYPDPWYTGVYSPGAEDEARQVRGDAVRVLADRATQASIEALRGLRRKFPELTWLSQSILRTREALRQQTWIAPDVERILNLAASSSNRIVESGEQLLDVLVESLQHLQEDLQGEIGSSSTLWDNLGDGAANPKDEQELSDFIARHFRRDLADRGVVAGREVVIRRGGAGGAPGQRTDIYVTAVPSGSHRPVPPISVILEVKGSWHPDVLSAMETQLAGDYLANNQRSQHGLFVVGWYSSPRWKNSPGRRRTERLKSIEELQSRLDAQAEALCRDGRRLRAFVLDVTWR